MMAMGDLGDIRETKRWWSREMLLVVGPAKCSCELMVRTQNVDGLGRCDHPAWGRFSEDIVHVTVTVFGPAHSQASCAIA